MTLNKCVFLDRDGVLNRERGQYTYKVDDFEILPAVSEALRVLKQNGYLIVVITNQAGIAKGLYKKDDVMKCHERLQDATSNQIDDIYFCPHHPVTTESLLRKPDSLMIEKAIAKWNVDTNSSFMIGDSERDLVAAEKAGVKGILIENGGDRKTITAPRAQNLLDAVTHFVLK